LPKFQPLSRVHERCKRQTDGFAIAKTRPERNVVTKIIEVCTMRRDLWCYSVYTPSRIDDRAFTVATARPWNGLFQYVISAPSLPSFRTCHYTYLFSLPYLWPFTVCVQCPRSDGRHVGHVTYLHTPVSWRSVAAPGMGWRAA